ncbi:MAG TPA: hypothetical protein GX717_08240, partial [Clostridiaceae bacterium]|nr:hypothetical protein [Clostridiaceae bacterium]
MSKQYKSAKWLGIIILALVIVGGVLYATLIQSTDVTVVSGYVGGEKIGLLEDAEVQKILADRYDIRIDYAKAGSLDMVRADLSGRDFLWPSSQTALEYYQREHGKPLRSETILNTPIVLYTFTPVLDALTDQGVVTTIDGVHYLDMVEFTETYLVSGKKWSDLSLDLYGQIVIDTTDPTKSNSGNMFSGLLANSLNGGSVVTEQSVAKVLPDLEQIFASLGYMETSSADLFQQYLSTGYGSKTMVAGYENQLLEFAAEHPDVWQQVKDDIVILYPNPTVWSTHIMISLTEEGNTLIEALQDPEIKEIAWRRHGFRTGVSGTIKDLDQFDV